MNFVCPLVIRTKFLIAEIQVHFDLMKERRSKSSYI